MEISPQEREWFAREIHDSRISLYRLALSITGDPHEAEEAVAEAVYRAYVKFRSLRDRERFHSWILKITANAARGLCRRRGKTISLRRSRQNPSFRDRRATTPYGRWCRCSPRISGRQWCCSIMRI